VDVSAVAPRRLRLRRAVARAGLGGGFADMGGGAYYESFYVAFMAITGSKELNPVTVAEKVLSIAIVVVGTGMSLTLVGNIAALLSTMDQASAAYRCVLGVLFDGCLGRFWVYFRVCLRPIFSVSRACFSLIFGDLRLFFSVSWACFSLFFANFHTIFRCFSLIFANFRYFSLIFTPFSLFFRCFFGLI
jgi:hypothetical protein